MDSMEKIFGKTAQMTVLKNLIENQNEPTYLSGIAEETGLSHSSVSRVITPLVLSGIVQEKPLGKQIRTFQLNMPRLSLLLSAWEYTISAAVWPVMA